MRKFENIVSSYPQGGVALASPAIAPMLAQCSPFPVFAVSEGNNDRNNINFDHASSPFSFINAQSVNPIYVALRSLSNTNPAAYCYLQERFELRDSFNSDL